MNVKKVLLSIGSLATIAVSTTAVSFYSKTINKKNMQDISEHNRIISKISISLIDSQTNIYDTSAYIQPRFFRKGIPTKFANKHTNHYHHNVAHKHHPKIIHHLNWIFIITSAVIATILLTIIAIATYVSIFKKDNQIKELLEQMKSKQKGNLKNEKEKKSLN